MAHWKRFKFFDIDRNVFEFRNKSLIFQWKFELPEYSESIDPGLDLLEFITF